MYDVHAATLSALGHIDIYLLDQVMKNRYLPGQRLLDAGSGGGRNLHWFALGNFELYAIDANAEAINGLKLKYPDWKDERFQVAALESVPFADDYFHHIICSAVLHFAENEIHFLSMFAEMIRVLKPGGSIFIRMTSDMGIEFQVEPLGDGIFDLPDGSRRFLLTRALLQEILRQFPVQLLEPVKTVNVQDTRCMTTLVIEKLPPFYQETVFRNT
jgi:tellurite methyltransferase